jgi:hypothetical protein
MCHVLMSRWAILWLLCFGECLSRENKPKVFICYAGVDNLEIFQSNYRLLQGTGGKDNNNGNGDGYQSHCLIILSENLTHALEKIVGNSCLVTEFYRGEIIDYLKLLTPSLVSRAGYSHVLILDSQTKLLNYNLNLALNIMTRNNLSVALPHLQLAAAAAGQTGAEAAEANSNSSPHSVGKTTEILELYAPIFTVATWRCFWDMINPGLNPSGSGVDIYFYHYCQQKMIEDEVIKKRTTTSPLIPQTSSVALQIGHLNSLRISRLPFVMKPFQNQKLDSQHQLQVWIDYIRNERGGVILKGEKVGTSRDLT